MQFDVEEDRDNFDYIYRIEDLVIRDGRQYKELRNMISKFQRYESAEIQKDPNAIQRVYFGDKGVRPMIGHIREVMSGWGNIRKKSDEEKAHLTKIIDNFSKYAEHFQMYNAGMFIHGRLSAFCFNEVVNQKYISSHFAYANKNIPGIFQYFDSQLFSKLLYDGFEYINLHQDLGKPGLRQFKQSYRPAFFLKKYTISPKT
jgi:hypothetical protein